jgi:hypothetical protein
VRWRVAEHVLREEREKEEHRDELGDRDKSHQVNGGQTLAPKVPSGTSAFTERAWLTTEGSRTSRGLGAPS